ncbi:hypothetical protein LN042_22925 [Kitasatospora sp. RB6PN24]|uniref:hypothetical protein n=1 Tax=Kitasatospora humi TaxID=2893891 RepID=UPI001E2BE52D|nr:hypothetical protein [Kitasatospora humi]MCC9309889.1 hypothetical protein [Kitasatospora humi]
MVEQSNSPTSGGPAVHRFDSTAEAYDATQCDEEIRDGDVLVIEAESVVGFLVKAWPVSATAARGELHGFQGPIEEFKGGAYVASHRAACVLAAELGFEVAAPAGAPEAEAAAAPADEEPTAPAPEGRAVVEFYSAVLFPGNREQRLTVRPVGSDDFSLYVPMPYQPHPDVDGILTAFGWRTAEPFRYNASANRDQAVAVPAEPADTPEAAALRDAFARFTAAQETARSFGGNPHMRPVVVDGEEHPVGWTFRVGFGEGASFGAVTAEGRLLTRADGTHYPTRAIAETAIVSQHTSPTGTEREPAHCVHGRVVAPGVTGAPVAECSAASNGPEWGAFAAADAETAWYVTGCAVDVANRAAEENAEMDDTDPEDPYNTWGRICTEHPEYPAGTCSECNSEEEPAQEEPAQEEADEGEAVLGRYVVAVGANSDYWPTFNDRERAAAHAASYGLTTAAVRDRTARADVAGARLRCSDGRVRTATHRDTVNGTEWVFTEDGTAWQADKSEMIDTSRVAEVRTAAEAAARVAAAPGATDPERLAALEDLGKALRYLSDADPLCAAAVARADAQRVTFTGTLADIAPGDIVHVEGIRASVLATGTAEESAVRGDRPRWWADVLGVVDEEDRRLSFRRPFAIGRFADVAAAEPVTIERPLTTR